jgi:hypothetical protein
VRRLSSLLSSDRSGGVERGTCLSLISLTSLVGKRGEGLMLDNLMFYVYIPFRESFHRMGIDVAQ